MMLMDEEALRICIREIGDNTHTARLVMKGDWVGAIMYIKTHDLDKDISYNMQRPGLSARVVAYRALVDLLEEG